MLKKSDFYFDLPEELIAQDPLEDRSSSRLLMLDKNTGEVSHHIFKEVLDYLKEGDCLVLNNTKVIPARLLGEREGTGGHVEVLLLKRKDKDVWETLVKPGKKCKPGNFIGIPSGKQRCRQTRKCTHNQKSRLFLKGKDTKGFIQTPSRQNDSTNANDCRIG